MRGLPVFVLHRLRAKQQRFHDCFKDKGLFQTQQNKNENSVNIVKEQDHIESVEETRCLGLMVDRNLNWGSHTDHVIKKINSGIYALH